MQSTQSKLFEQNLFNQSLKSSLKQNSNINVEGKTYIFNLVQFIYQKMEKQYHITLPKEQIIERLKTFSIAESSKLASPEPLEYNIVQNKIVIQADAIEDHNHAFCQALLEMALVKEVGKGIDNRNFLAIKKGILEICANNLVGNNGEKGIYEEEQEIVNLMDVIAEGQILDSFIKGDGKKLEETIQKYRFTGIRDWANYNLSYRFNSTTVQNKNDIKKVSSFIEIRKSLIVHFFNQSSDKIDLQMKSFEANLGIPNGMHSKDEIINYYYYKKNQQNVELNLLQDKIPYVDSKSNIQDNTYLYYNGSNVYSAGTMKK